jgi:DNA-binding response OmpR family regulator
MKNILIIDDDTNVCEELADRIEAMGHQSFSVHCQNDALASIEKSDAALDLILLDLEIPVKPEGTTRRETGLHLLDRLVGKPGTPPIIVITSHGKGQHNLCRDVMQRGAKGFISKPFDEDPPEEQIKKVLSDGIPDITPAKAQPTLQPFQGGDLVVHESHIDLAQVEIGGIRTGSIIRRVITVLAPKPGENAKKMSAKALSDALGNIGAPSVTSAINEFRGQCIEKMRAAGWNCGRNDIIETVPGGGYRIKSWILVREGFDEHVLPQIDSDADQILKFFSVHSTRTHRQVREGVDFSSLRVKAALARLTESKRLKLVSGSGATTTYGLIPPP